MPYFKDTGGALHFLSTEDIAIGGEKYLPLDCVAITDAQADAIRNPTLTLAQVQAAKVAELSAACAAQIYAGFTSSALGAAHTYPAKDKDQANLSGSVVASMLPNLPAGWTTPFWCMDAAGAWAFVPHTAAQIQQVGADGKAAVVTALEKNAALAAQVMADTTVAAVQAVAW